MEQGAMNNPLLNLEIALRMSPNLLFVGFPFLNLARLSRLGYGFRLMPPLVVGRQVQIAWQETDLEAGLEPLSFCLG